MSDIFFLISRDDETGQENVSAFLPGANALACDNTHPNFESIRQIAQDAIDYTRSGGIYGAEADESVADLFDVAETVAARFDALTERVSVANGRVYFDGDEVENAITKQIVRFLTEKVTDWVPLVRFFEKVQTNPQEHSREQLYEWLDRHDFTINYDGNIVAYKGVQSDGKGGYQSLHAGYGIVNGEVIQHGYIPNAIGDTIEIPRSMVHADPAVGCSVGMHVGTYEYAKGYASRGLLLKVEVNPRDVVSVPTDCNAQKVRVCRYVVLDAIQEKIEDAFDYSSIPEEEALDEDVFAVDYDDEDEDDEEDYCEACGGPCDYC